MIYLFLGENAYCAQQKFAALRGAFLQKGGSSSAITEIAGDLVSFEELSALIDSNNVFKQKQLVILKHALLEHLDMREFLRARGGELRTTKDVFIFWERALPDDATKKFFTTYAEKIQLLDGENGEHTIKWILKEIKERWIGGDSTLEQKALARYSRGGAWAVIGMLDRIALGDNDRDSLAQNSTTSASFGNKEVFRIVDALFQRPLFAGITTLYAALTHGVVTSEEALRVIIWQMKNMVLVTRGESKELSGFVIQKAKRLSSSYPQAVAERLWREGILADSAMRRDKKNAYEHLERFVFSIKTPRATNRVEDEI